MGMTKYDGFSLDEANDYNIIKTDTDFYVVNSGKVANALKAVHRKEENLPLRILSVSFKDYSFRGVSTSRFMAGGYCFLEYVFHDINASSDIEGIIFDAYYDDTGTIVAKIYEKVKRDQNGDIKVHILYDPNDTKYDRLRIHFNQIIASSPELKETVQIIRPFVKVLEDSISKLPSFDGLDLEPPQKTDASIYLPVEGTYNSKFYARLYLLRNHSVENIIISMFDMIQYQIPVKANNESLILLIYGTHLLESVMMPDMLNTALGISLCDNTDLCIRENSPIIDSILSVREVVKRASCDVESLKLQSVYTKYEELVSSLYSWIKETQKKATQEYNKSEYGQVKWVAEYKLYNLVNFWYPDAIFQYSPSWLGGQSIDIFLPSESVGIEYQGRQHFEPIDYFGGEEKLLDNARRDQVKLSLSEDNGVTLYYWMYDQKVTFSAVSDFLNKRPNDIYDQLDSFNITPVAEILGKVQTFAQTENKRKKEEKKLEKQLSLEVIRQYSSSGEFLTEFNTIKDASSYSGISMTSIQKCLVGDRKTAGGFFWKRETRDSLPQKIEVNEDIQSRKTFENTGLPKPVIQIDAHTGEVIQIHSSIGQAARSVGIHSKGIKDVINGKQRTAGGYSWQFAEQ